jgi:hypothetical protein
MEICVSEIVVSISVEEYFTLSALIQRNIWFLVLGILHGVQDKFPYDVSGAAVGPIFNGHKLEQIPKTKHQYLFHGESLKSRKKYLSET